MTHGLRAVLALVAAVGLAGLGGGGQTPRSPADAEARRAAERLRALRHEAESLAAQERTLLVELRQLEIERDLRNAELARVTAELSAATEELTRVEAQTRGLEAQAVAQEPEVAARLIELYKLGRAGYWRMLLDVDDIRAIGRAYRSVSTLAHHDQERLDAHRRTLAALAAARAALETRRAEAQVLEADARLARAAAERAVSAYSQRVADIDARRDLNAQLTGELQVASERLQAAVGTLAAGPGRPAATGLPLAPFRGQLDWPIDGPILASFGRQARTRFGPAFRRNGIEIGGDGGAPVHAVHDATVVFADEFTGYGDLVILDHGDQAYSLYGYLGTLGVRKGDTVGRGAEIGVVGHPPTGESPRLYFELRVDGQPVDPVEWLRKR